MLKGLPKDMVRTWWEGDGRLGVPSETEEDESSI